MAANGVFLTTADICKIAAQQKAPRFYVDARQALIQYKNYKQGTSCIQHEEKRRMYTEIFARYEAIMNAMPTECNYAYRYLIMEKVLAQEAPSFYYGENSAIKMYYRFMLDMRRKNRLK